MGKLARNTRKQEVGGGRIVIVGGFSELVDPYICKRLKDGNNDDNLYSLIWRFICITFNLRTGQEIIT